MLKKVGSLKISWPRSLLSLSCIELGGASWLHMQWSARRLWRLFTACALNVNEGNG